LITAGEYSTWLRTNNGILLATFRPVNNISYKNLNLLSRAVAELRQTGACSDTEEPERAFAAVAQSDCIDWMPFNKL